MEFDLFGNDKGTWIVKIRDDDGNFTECSFEDQAQALNCAASKSAEAHLKKARDAISQLQPDMAPAYGVKRELDKTIATFIQYKNGFAPSN